MDTSKEFVAGSLGGAAGILVGSPLDVLKTRMQATSASNYTLLNGCKEILREDGVAGFFRGVLPPLIGQSLFTSISFSAYSGAVDVLESQYGPVDPAKTYSFTYSMVAGSFGGFCTSFVSTPFELLKIQEQISHKKLTPIAQMKSSSREIMHKRGPFGFFAGWGITAIRDTPATGMYFAVYYEGKEMLGTLMYGEESRSADHDEAGRTFIELVSGGVAGVVSWAMAIPIDVVKTNIQWDAISGQPRRYAGIVDCTKQIYGEGGLSAFTRGSFPILARAFPVNAVTFLGYEQAMRLMA